jgi:hypothetical protein
MALCTICGNDASVLLYRRPEGSERPLGLEAFCTPCWRREGESLARLLCEPQWQLDVRDPELTGIPAPRVEYFLALERVAAEADLEVLARGLREYSRESGRPLPPELRDFASRHARAGA